MFLQEIVNYFADATSVSSDSSTVKATLVATSGTVICAALAALVTIYQRRRDTSTPDGESKPKSDLPAQVDGEPDRETESDRLESYLRDQIIQLEEELESIRNELLKVRGYLWKRGVDPNTNRRYRPEHE